MPVAEEELVAVLSTLDEDALFGLARTVTQGLKKNATPKEAIQNIIKYSPDYISILRRKAVTREILFNYLDENNIKVKLPTTKNELIDVIAENWNIPRISSQSQEDTASEFHNTVVAQKTNKETSNVNSMAEQFAKWFYSMLNGNECGAEHFFSDASLKLNFYVNGDCDDSTLIENDPEEITSTLLKTRLQHNLHFNPNDTQDGIQGRMDSHGLVMVLTCGTLHMQNICAGVFEQVFALARDPFCDNNWKIKRTELNLRAKSNVLESPRLCDSDLTSELLMLPSE